MYNECRSILEEDIRYLRQRINTLEDRSLDMKLILIQLAIDCNWNNEQIQNVIGATDSELEFFTGE